MEFLPGRIRLSDIVNGTLGVGIIPWARIRRSTLTGTNPGAVTLVAGGTEIFELAFGSIGGSDLFLCTFSWDVLKGATAGDTTIQMEQKTGPGQVSWGQSTFIARNVVFGQPANSNWRRTWTIWGQTNAGGNYTARLFGLSLGSNGTIAAAAAGFEAYLINGA